MQFLQSLILTAIITFQIAIADQAYDQDHQAVFACVQNAYEPVGERIAVCGGASKTDSNKYESQSCVNRFILPMNQFVALCENDVTDSSISVQFHENFTVTRANTVVNDPYTHNCIGAPVQEVRCCRKNAFNFPQNVSTIPSEHFFQLSKFLIIS
ncbi:hypothetical protein PGT21_023980 [Puccinia graminis f. sp. tritici]|uniref:Uncharacterized protein n=1 Tax=Puccinia graminis f. sp. tritici TaxID=56615 RepID=A0A5B0PNH8_PUCGR|nr:hypothetical protein PGT21_023980 [Puccinia graminis f. sp. tritici]